MIVLFIFLCVGAIVNGIELSGFGHSCTPTTPCELCQGNCNDDTDCAGDSYCFQNYHSSNEVPGCTTPTHTEVPNQNYCAKYKRLASVLNSAVTDCNSNSELEVWANVGIQGAETFALASESWTTGNFEVTGDFTVPEGTITSVDIADGTITSVNIADGAIASADIADGTITRDDIASHTIQSHQIYPNTLGAAEIAPNAITSSELAGNSVLSGSIADGTITAADIANDAVTSDKLADSISVTNLDVTGKLEAKSDAEIQGYLRLTAPKWWSSNVNAGAAFSSTVPSLGPGVFNTDNVWHKFSIFADGIIYSTTYVAASDERIKENIQPLADFEALHIIRTLDAKSYEYKDKYERGWNRTLGFIAQDVQKHIPEAVKVISKEIPSIYDWVEVRFFKQGEQYNMKLLNRVLEPGKYAFYVSDTDDNKMTTVKSVDMTTEDGITFISNNKHDKVFLRGPYVDDFLTIDKNKIFAVAYAALQQVDKNQQTLTERVTELEQQNILALENTIKTQTALIAKLEERLTALENNN